MLAGFNSYFSGEAVLCAAVTLLSMVIGLTLLACFMQTDLVGYLKGLAIAAAFAFVPACAFILANPSRWLVYLIEGISVSVYSLFIIFDTTLIINIYSTDEYISAVVSLYIDIIILFVYLLQMFGSN
jgi:FtsH-binding integral membrane protein